MFQSPDFAAMVDAAAKRQCEPLKNDPYLLGYFVGNEPAWPGRELELAGVILKERSGTHTGGVKGLSGGRRYS